MLYDAGFALDAANNIHLVYANNHDSNIIHMERVDGVWKREIVIFRSAALTSDEAASIEDSDYITVTLEQVAYEKGYLCVYANWFSVKPKLFSKKYCKRDSVWVGSKLNRPDGPRPIGQAMEPDSEYPVFEFTVAEFRLDDGRLLFIENEDYDTLALQSDYFYLIDEDAGVKQPYGLPPFALGPLISNGLQYIDYQPNVMTVSRLPFFVDGQWDGVSFIYAVQYVLEDRLDYTKRRAEIIYFHVSFDGSTWHFAKFHEEDAIDQWRMRALNYIFWHNKRTTILDRAFFIKKDATSGAVYLEPLPQAYQAIYKAVERTNVSPIFNVNISAISNYMDLVDADGNVHWLQDDGAGFTVRVHYYRYNPNADDPAAPEVREFIEQSRW